jgi:uncharacterized protein YndB with AHSA1/START domain
MAMGRFLILVLLALAVAYFVPAPVAHYDAALEVDASRERVWEALSDLSQLSRWNSAVDSTVFLTPQRDGVDTEFRIDGVVTSTLRAERWEPFNSMGFSVRLKPRFTYDHVLRYSVQYRFTNRTVVRVEEEYRMAGGYLGHLFGVLLFDRMREPYRMAALSYLKKLAETGFGLGT